MAGARLERLGDKKHRAVMQACGFSMKMTEAECVAKLFEMYADWQGNKAKPRLGPLL